MTMTVYKCMGGTMLSKCFEYDRIPIIGLNELQLRIKKQIEKKVEEGIYSFEAVPCCVCSSKKQMLKNLGVTNYG